MLHIRSRNHLPSQEKGVFSAVFTSSNVDAVEHICIQCKVPLPAHMNPNCPFNMVPSEPFEASREGHPVTLSHFPRKGSKIDVT